MSLCGHPPTPQTVMELAEELRSDRRLPETPPLGHNWIQKLRSRHPELMTIWTRSIDTSRLEGASPEQLAPWFAEMGALLSKHHYSPGNIYKMDETGFGIGHSQSTWVMTVVDRGAKDEGKKQPKAWKGMGPQQEWVTSIECVSAAGIALPPLVIFKGASFNSRYLPASVLDLVPSWRWSTSNTGWSNDTLAYVTLHDCNQSVTHGPRMTLVFNSPDH